MQRTDHIVIGKIVAHHGIKGEIKIYPFTDDVTKFERFEHLFLEPAQQRLEIASCRIHKNMPLILFEGIDTIEKGLHLIGKEVSAEREVLDDGEGGHFIVDLIGLRAQDASGAFLGVIRNVIQNSAQDLYEIKHPSGRLFLVPVVDEFVKEISVEGGWVTLDLPDGLLALYGIDSDDMSDRGGDQPCPRSKP